MTKLPKELVGFTAPKVVNQDGLVFENARGGPYKYGKAMPATALNLKAARYGLL